MSQRAKTTIVSFFLIAVGAFATSACGSWAPVANPGKCTMDRHWEPSEQDEQGKWQEGRCVWDEGRERRP